MNIISDKTINNKCSKCGNCCGLFIPFTNKELNIIKDYVSKHNILPCNRLKGLTFTARCCFYDEDKKCCNIYEVRPYVCKDFMCNHKDWIKRRDEYEKYGDYNGTTESNSILATFDDLIYNDCEPIIRYMMSLMSTNDSKELLNIFKSAKRLDLLKYLTVENDKGEIISGKELLSRGE